MARKKKAPGRYVAQNKKARHDYTIVDTFEAGLILYGTEVKSLRAGRASLGDAYAAEKDGGLFLFNSHISEYGSASRFNHEPLRPRKLLMHRREIARLLGAVQRQGMTLIPLSIYFSDRGYAKVELGLAQGRKAHDKRAAIKDREWNRDKARMLRGRGDF